MIRSLERFGVAGAESGAIWTRTGRPFFSDPQTTEALLARLRAAVDVAGLWDQLDTSWLLLDAEVMPWSAKAAALIDAQYAPVAAASRAGLSATDEALARARARGVPVEALADRFADREKRTAAYAAPGRHTSGQSPASLT